jgi:transcriptional regulator with XRE-family HTH domain
MGTKGKTTIAKLRQWRVARGYSLEEAAAKILVDGEPCTKSTWHGWEHGKVPKPPFMIALCDLTGLQPNDFYPRADGRIYGESDSGPGSANGSEPGARRPGSNGEPPQMALAI